MYKHNDSINIDLLEWIHWIIYLKQLFFWVIIAMQWLYQRI